MARWLRCKLNSMVGEHFESSLVWGFEVSHWQQVCGYKVQYITQVIVLL